MIENLQRDLKMKEQTRFHVKKPSRKSNYQRIFSFQQTVKVESGPRNGETKGIKNFQSKHETLFQEGCGQTRDRQKSNSYRCVKSSNIRAAGVAPGKSKFRHPVVIRGMRPHPHLTLSPPEEYTRARLLDFNLIFGGDFDFAQRALRSQRHIPGGNDFSAR